MSIVGCRATHLALLCALAFANTANAQFSRFPMAGDWAQNRGNLIDIPITGDVPCDINRQSNPPPPFVMGDFGQPLRAAAAGCIRASASVTVMGPAPRTITVKGRAFRQTGATRRSAALPLVPSIVQLATSFTFQGPASTTVWGFPSGVATGRFSANAYLNQPGRAGANFAWCPGGATQNPVCSTPDPNVHGGVYNGLVRYRAGANAFGGTMTMLVKGAGTLTVKFDPGPLGTVRVLHLPIDGAYVQQPGAPYANANVIALSSGTVKQSPVYTAGGRIQGSATPSPTIMTGSTAILGYGFPWTTGTVYVRNTGSLQGMPATTTLSASGSDSRTPGGGGRITLVAGGLSVRLNPNASFSSIDVVQMRILRETMPSSSPAGLAVGALLLLLAVGHACRRRF